MNLDNPYLEHLGVQLADWGGGRCTMQLDIEPRHLNRSGSLHGGLAATLLDAACGYAGLSATHEVAGGAAPDNGVTVMLTVSFTGKVQQGRVRALAQVTTAGHKLYFASAELRSDDNRLIATAQGSFKRTLAKG